MIAAPRRRFNLSDILILVAATALSLVVVRYIVALNLLNTPDRYSNMVAIVAINLASPVLVALSLAAFLICIRQPRLPLRRLARDPGFVAMSVVVMTTVYYVVHLTMRLIASYYSEPHFFRRISFDFLVICSPRWDGISRSPGPYWPSRENGDFDPVEMVNSPPF